MKTNYSISRAPSGIFYLWCYDSRGKGQKISTGCRLKSGAKAFAVRLERGKSLPNRKGTSELLRNSKMSI